MDGADDLRLAFDTSQRAADLALAYFESGVAATLKADGTPVTEADRAVEELIRATLSAARPDDAILGEELGRLGESERVWIIDPIDGTSFFSRRDPNWRVHIALEVAGTIEIAVVTSPALRRCWWATRGEGAFESSWPRNESEATRLAVSTTSTLAEARLEVLDDASRARLPPGAPRAPASPLPLVELVRGQIDAFLAECCHIWDHAPWILLVEEAGGRFTDRTGGHAGDQGGGLYSNANLHGQLLEALRYPAAAMSSGAPNGLITMETDCKIASTTIDATPEAIFAVLADPSAHADIDGTGWVRDPLDRQRITAAGQVFRMAMYHPQHPDKNYEIANRVEVFEEPHAIAWQPGNESPETKDLSFGGWIWRYDLEATGPSATTVTLTYDWSAVAPEVREHIAFPPFAPDHLDNSLAHLCDLVARNTTS